MSFNDAHSNLVGIAILSESEPGVRYCLEQVVGEGGMGTAYLAQRESAGGSAPVVVKIMRDDLGAAEIAPHVVAQKETIALRRLNEALPPSPFVVRFVDSGTLAGEGNVRTPWTAIEYVHGGVEGTTLEDRVTYSLHKTGYAFDATRAAHAIRCLAAGLTAIHGVGVIHRDVTPGNVLCCGFGAREIFKIADFGVARASGMELTFDGLCAGTVGYSAPEAAGKNAAPPTDVFAFAAVVFYLLTGQNYFAADSAVEALHLVIAPTRPSIADHPTLSPDLAEQPDVCKAIDLALARATSLDIRKRPQTPELLAAELLPHLGDPNSAPRSTRVLLSAVQSSGEQAGQSHRFTVRHRRQAGFAARSAAWDADGHALVLLEQGAGFWNGDTWLDASPVLTAVPGPLTFTGRHEAGGWLVGGEGLSLVNARGVGDSLPPPAPGARLWLASGRLGDLLLTAGVDAAGVTTLWPLVARRYLRGIKLPFAGSISVLDRLDDERFVIAGRRAEGGGFAAVVAPLESEIQQLTIPDVRALLAGSSSLERSVALVTGTQGVVLRVESGAVTSTVIPGAPDLSAGATDVLGRDWVASAGALWTREPGDARPWSLAWRDADWNVPFVSLIAEPGFVLAMTLDGGIVEGRMSV